MLSTSSSASSLVAAGCIAERWNVIRRSPGHSPHLSVNCSKATAWILERGGCVPSRSVACARGDSRQQGSIS